MKKIGYSYIAAGAAQPFKKGTWKHMQESYYEAIEALLNGLVVNTTLANALYGCLDSTPGTGTFTISAGAIYYQGEIYLVDAATFTPGGGQTAVCTITTTYYTDPTADPVTFTDAATHNVHEIRTIVIAAGVSGSGTFNFSAVKFFSTALKTKSLVIGDITVSAGTYTVVGGTYSYYIVGKLLYLTIQCNLTGTSVANTYFQFLLPDGLVAAATSYGIGFTASGSDLNEILTISGAGNNVSFKRINSAAFPAFTLGTQLQTTVVLKLV